MESPVLDDVLDGVLHLTLNRPAKLNPFTYEMIGLLLEQLDRADHDPAIRAILIDGAGGNFSSGDDIKSMGEHPHRIPAGAHATREFQQRLLKRWYWFPKPTIAAVRGRCHGIASDMMLAADFRIVSRTAAYGDIRARRAIPVGTGGTWLLPRMVGLPAASQMMLTGDVIDGEEMYRLGAGDGGGGGRGAGRAGLGLRQADGVWPDEGDRADEAGATTQSAGHV